MPVGTLDRWTTREAAELYGVGDWGGGYFDVSESGELVVRPRGEGGDTPPVSLYGLVRGLHERGMSPPLLLRFRDILASRISRITGAFAKAIGAAGYRGHYRGVYPVKVNQQQQVVEDITRFGRPLHYGLEVGSKAELAAALAYLDDREAFLICNGYKDAEFVRLALYGLKMGYRVVLVIEMPQELPLILGCAESMQLRPQLGVRAKLSSRGGGLWSESGGDRSVFGLTPSQIIGVVDQLRERGFLDCLELLHFHLGSQVPNIRDIRGALQEACRLYAGLALEGAPMGILDIGGGLAVDYDGSKTNFPSSRNYTLDEYCGDVVEAVMAATDEAGIEHPVIISESGRAVVAHHSVLVFSTFESNRFVNDELPAQDECGDHEAIVNLRALLGSASPRTAQECLHDALYYRDEVRSLFLHGAVSLRHRANAEQVFWHVMQRIAFLVRRLDYVPEELENIDAALADVYYGNFSVFQSLPDSWAIKQLFPIMPIHRLNERPGRRATLADLTCDCDGKIDRFIDLHDVKSTLPLHQPDGQDYLLGVFLVGAYQETLGDLHNLFGDTHVAAVGFGEDGAPRISREIVGDSVADVLSYVEYEASDLIRRIRRTAEEAVRDGHLTPGQRRDVVDAYEAGLRGYTYFED